MHLDSQLRRIVLLASFLISSSLLEGEFFSALPKFPVGPTPAGIAVGDFNGDGKPDLVLVNQNNLRISVVLGRGNGKFGPPISSTTTVAPAVVGPVFVGDFNGDHKLDIAFDASGVSVALGNGDGTFGPTVNYKVPNGALMVGVADVNGDGKLDLVYSGQSAAFTAVFLGNGDGNFQPFLSSPGTGCALADMNADGRSDLVGRSGIQFANADGTFQTAVSVSGLFDCPAIADFDGNGTLDLVGPASDGINVLFGNGKGSFQDPVAYHLGQGFATFWVGDFNGDGRPDLLANTDLGFAGILLNAGKGRFPVVANYRFPSILQFVVADFNRDGRSDIISTGSNDGYAEIAVPDPSGSLALPPIYVVKGFSASSVIAGDFNGDGRVDLAVTSQNLTSQEGAVGVLNVLLGKEKGTLRLSTSSIVGGHDTHYVATADLNRDGKLDLIFGNGDSVSVRLGRGNGTFQTPTNYPLPYISEIAVGDFNDDGVPDLAVNNAFTFGQILLGNGDGTFRSGTALPAGMQYLVSADFNKDGKQDLAISTTAGVGILLGNGDGTFQTPAVLRKGQIGSLQVGDFNGDGNPDLVAVGNPGAGAVASVYLGNGDGTLQAAKNRSIRVGVSPAAAATADFDGDGKADLAVILQSGLVAVLSGDGAGGFRAPSFHPGGFSFSPTILLATDLDGNGTPDLVFTDYYQNAVTVLLNRPTQQSDPAVIHGGSEQTP